MSMPQSPDYGRASPFLQQALAMRQVLYPKDKYPQGHPALASSLNNLASLHHEQGKLDEAERLQRDALVMRKRLTKGDHPDVARSLNNLANLLRDQGNMTDAERLHKDALDMLKRMFKGDHPSLATSLSNLGLVASSQGDLAAAREYLGQRAFEPTAV